MITQEMVKMVFDYNYLTGEFHRTVITDRWGNMTNVWRRVGTPRPDGYLEVMAFNMTLKLHRLAYLYMVGIDAPGEIDHTNGVRSDNRWSNLRVVTKSANMRNRGTNHNNTSGVSGVTWFGDCERWRARININGERVSLGLFETFDEAVAARRGAEQILGYHVNHGRRESWRG